MRIFRILVPTLCVFIISASSLTAQKRNFQLAKEAKKNDRKFVAAYAATEVLLHEDASKRMVRNSHEILAEFIDEGPEEMQSFIKDLESQAAKYHRDASVSKLSNVVSLIKQLIEYQENLEQISPERLAAPNKKSKPITVVKKSYDDEFKQAQVALLDVKSKAAEDYIQEARLISPKKNIDLLKKAYSHYEKARELNPEVKSEIKIEFTSLGDLIGLQILDQANKLLENSQNEYKLDSAYTLLKSASYYTQNGDVVNRENEIKLELCEFYYTKASNLLLEQSTPENIPEKQIQETESNDVEGIELKVNKTVLLSALQEKITGVSSENVEQTSNSGLSQVSTVSSINASNVGIESFKNSHRALFYLERLINIDEQYKDVETLIANAKRLTYYKDARDAKIYPSAQIGDLIWMTKNLNYAVGAEYQFYCFGGNPDDKRFIDEESAFYTYSVATKGSANSNGIKGICPVGWRVPSTEDWKNLKEMIVSDDANWSIFNPEFSGSNSLKMYDQQVDPCEKWTGGYYGVYWSSSLSEYTAYEGAERETKIDYIEFFQSSNPIPRKVGVENPLVRTGEDSKMVLGENTGNNKMMNCRCVMDAIATSEL
ncbi:FISUMP domain-containing protein [Cyclobacterium sp. 1_MG-2023]|uniref:FISUMP domain-containing protein n=1 Tax=Cyclobacterium sp. 1_MG-2023 TaxID=3062681 RepID=UPI0026E1F86A|nr:FISUMP domain-containing protein [Cyclobacterium sp. 1_MG-2023]MDO6435939.1 FISUMP domain-containing protein [Cyclobacterium sp. 1_MG-2023]